MNRYLLLTLPLMVSPATFASVATLTGGSLTVYATAGSSGGTIDIDNPAPLAPGMGFSSLTASASGTVPDPFYEGGFYDAESSATASANITFGLAGEMMFQLNATNSAFPAHVGAGSYLGASANSSVAVTFILDGETPATLEWHLDSLSSGDSQFSAQIKKDGVPLDIWEANYGIPVGYAFEPGLYEIYLMSSDGVVSFPFDPSPTSVSMTLTLALPVPAAVWLFGSAIAGLGVIGRRNAI